MIGTVIHTPHVGKIILTESLGSGSFAEVFKGYNVQTKQCFAVKVISKITLTDAEVELSRMEYETHGLVSSHTNVGEYKAALYFPPLWTHSPVPFFMNL